jgi:hypothetical protein
VPVSSWIETEDWEILFLGGKRMPGVAHVVIKLPSGLDVQKARGKKKARVKDVGLPPAEVSITLELLPGEEMAALERVINTLRPRGASIARPTLKIIHPNARLWGVSTVKIGEIGSPQPGPGGSYTVSINAIEHVENPTKIKKPAAKPENGDPSEWDVEPLIDPLRPSQSRAPQENFSSAVIPGVNISEGDIPGSGF